MAARWRVDGSAGIWLVRGDAREEARALRGELVAKEAAAARVDAWFPSGWGDEGTRTLAAIGRALVGGFPGDGVPEAAWLKGTLRRALLDGRVTAVRVGIRAPESGVEDEPVTMRRPASKEETWVEFVVVWAGEGTPIAGLRLTVEAPGRGREELQTDGNGRIRLAPVKSGTCRVSSSFAAVRAAQCVDFVTIAEPLESASRDQRARRRRDDEPAPRAIAALRQHHVQGKDTLASLAASVGLSWQDLARFNWGTDNPREVNQHLRDDVGCWKKTADGANYVFSDFDDPGVIVLPRPWSASDLATSETHYLQVRRLPPPPRFLTWSV